MRISDFPHFFRRKFKKTVRKLLKSLFSNGFPLFYLIYLKNYASDSKGIHSAISAIAQFIPSRPALVMPPAYPAPSPQG